MVRNIVTIFYDLPHIYVGRLNKESHSILQLGIVLSIEIWRTVDGVIFSNMINLLCHSQDLLISATVRKLNLRGRALIPNEGGSSTRRGLNRAS